MPTYLENLTINELSFVDKPANEASRVTIFKALGLNPLRRFNPLMGYLPPDRTTVCKDKRVVRPEPETRARVQALAKPSAAEEARLGLLLGDDNEPLETFEHAVERQRRLAPKMSRTAAMSKARRDHPDLYERFQGAASGAPVAKACNSALVKFMGLVDEERQRTGCSRTAAMAAVRKRSPAEFGKLNEP